MALFTKILKSTRLAAILLVASTCVHAEVKPHPLFSNGAVLPRDRPVPVWGIASEGETVTVSFRDQRISTTAKDGQWRVQLAPLKLGPAATLIIAGKNTVTLSDILVGDVWLCSGQSNMNYSLNQIGASPAIIAAAEDPELRIYAVRKNAADTPQTTVAGAWVSSSAQLAPGLSAVPYFFGRDLRKALKIPVGIINSSVNGTPGEAWVSIDTLTANADLKPFLDRQAAAIATFESPEAARKLDEENKKITADYEKAAEKALAEGKPKPRAPALKTPASPAASLNRPGGLYNAMIAPLLPFPIKGIAWYQGESNIGAPRLYRPLLPALIASWRTAWGEETLPFLIVQIAPYRDNTPEVREAQFLAWRTTPHTALIVTTDVGNAGNIHPPNKEPVGTRLALAALALAYAEPITYSGPAFRKAEVQGNKIVLHFDHVGGGLLARDGPLTGFDIAGADKNFGAANAVIVGDTVEISNPKVSAPVAARYGWANVPVGNLWNKDGLPASPFRTDPE